MYQARSTGGSAVSCSQRIFHRAIQGRTLSDNNGHLCRGGYDGVYIGHLEKPGIAFTFLCWAAALAFSRSWCRTPMHDFAGARLCRDDREHLFPYPLHRRRAEINAGRRRACSDRTRAYCFGHSYRGIPACRLIVVPVEARTSKLPIESQSIS